MAELTPRERDNLAAEVVALRNTLEILLAQLLGGIAGLDATIAAVEQSLSNPSEAVAQIEAVIDEAKFLRDRISEMEWNDDEVFRQFDGYVSPSISRLKDALTALDGEKNDG